MNKNELKAKTVWHKIFNIPFKAGDVVELFVKRTPSDNWHLVQIKINYVDFERKTECNLHGIVVKAEMEELLRKYYVFKTENVRRLISRERQRKKNY